MYPTLKEPAIEPQPERKPDGKAQSSTARKPLTLPRLLDMHSTGEKIVSLTCYDASFAALLDRCGVDVLLVGDSLGMVLQGEASTLPVTLEQMAYHVRCVARGNRSAWIVGDLPFGAYHESHAQAYASSAALMAAGAHMVKIEGTAADNSWYVETIRFLTARGIPVCAHLGLTPQSVHALGGYRVQGKSDSAGQRLKFDSVAVQDAGARMLVLEMVAATLAGEISESLKIPTIGIGAGKDCAGQVLVLYDMLGIYPGRKARFVQNFIDAGGRSRSIEEAVGAYVQAVKSGEFPQPEHSY
jgi:3-methyl-2-oxobutanoate hydroxymethyltransferase